MMILPVQGVSPKNKKKKGGKKNQGAQGPGDVQVNLIVDPTMFSGRRDQEEEDSDHDPQEVDVHERRRRPKRRLGYLAGLAVEAAWKFGSFSTEVAAGV